MIRKFTLFFISCLVVASNLAAQQIGAGFSSINALAPEPASAQTGEKPQSKPWKYDGKWWAVFPNSGGTYLWRLDGTGWTNVLKLSSRTSSQADCKVAGNITHVFLYQGPSSQMASVEYVPETKTYKLWSKRTSTVGISLDKGVETATIDIDSHGRMWLASAGVNDINMRWSDPPYTNWSSPITIATGVLDDDICAVIALPGKIGVLWSNQSTKRFGFKTHTDGADPSVWTADEVPASQSALNVGKGMADDHINMAVASDGTLYAAVKTSYDTKGYPVVALLVRRPTGKWDNLYEVARIGTRPIVILNEEQGRLKVIYTSNNSGGNILYKETATSSISFGSQLTLLNGTYNNPTSSKDNYNPDVVVLVSNNTHVVGVLASDGAVITTAPAAPLLASPSNGATDVPVSPWLSWKASTGADSYQVQVSLAKDFSSRVFDKSGIAGTSVQVSGLSNGTVYHWRARASNAAGTSAWSSAWSFTTETGTSPTSDLVAHWMMDEGGGGTLADVSGYDNHASITGSPSWVAGTSGLALRLSGSKQYATAPDKGPLDITGQITLAMWIKPEMLANQYLLHKALVNVTDGYELSLTSAGLVFFRFNQASSGELYRVNSSTKYSGDGATWIHVAATYDGITARIYLNGVEDRKKSFSSPPPIAANNLALGIGAQHDGFRSFKGAMDEARIYNRALSASEVMQLATTSAMATAQTAGLLALEPLSDVKVYPNPFSNRATLSFSLPKGGAYELTLYDTRGAEITSLGKGSAVAGGLNSVEIDGSHLPRGLYIVRLQTSEGARAIRLSLSK